MAITNAQQYQQLVKKDANGKRPGYRGSDWGSSSSGPSYGGMGSIGSGGNPNRSTNTGQGRQDRDSQYTGGGYDSSKNVSKRTTTTSGKGGGSGYTGTTVPPKKPKKTKDNSTKSNVFTNYLENSLLSKGLQAAKNSKFVASLNARQREQYLENLKEEDNELYQQTVDDLAKLGYATRDVELYGPESKGAGRDIEIFTDLGEDQAKSILNTVVDNNEGGVGTLYDDYLDSRNTSLNTPTGGGDDQVIDPCKGPNPPAYCFVDDKKEEDEVNPRDYSGLAPRFAGSIFDFTGLAEGGIARTGAMDGGRMRQMEMMQDEDDPTGGIMDLESGRQMYFLGKLVKKAGRAIKKVVKSPIGKAALLYFGGNALMGAGGGKGLGSFFGKGSFNPLKALITTTGQDGAASGLGLSKLGQIFNKFGMATGEGNLTLGGKLGLSFGVPFALDALGVGKEENNDDAYKKYMEEMRLNIPAIRARRNLAAAFDGGTYNYEAYADGGRTGYQEGGDAEPVAKKTMPLLDMDGKEKDYRETGGFVDIGRMERADDVPARLSKNEFVFTADAVRNAGEGDIDKGAEVMYNMMKNLESGGEVSEESQGLDGAREMFQTSKRLEEVL